MLSKPVAQLNQMSLMQQQGMVTLSHFNFASTKVKYDAKKTILIRGLTAETTNDMVRESFKKFGEIKNIKMLKKQNKPAWCLI